MRRGVLLPKGGLTRRKGEGRWFSCEERKKKGGKKEEEDKTSEREGGLWAGTNKRNV